MQSNDLNRYFGHPLFCDRNFDSFPSYNNVNLCAILLYWTSTLHSFVFFWMFTCLSFCDGIHCCCSTVLLIKWFSSLVLECIWHILKAVGYQRNPTSLRVCLFGTFIFMLFFMFMHWQHNFIFPPLLCCDSFILIRYTVLQTSWLFS